MTQPDSTMLRHEGTKRLLARPMNRLEYNEYRGWTVPANEDPATPGYLVEYEDGGTANDSRHAGYISWSPADVFERSYQPIATFVQRMRIEHKALEAKVTAIEKFIPSDAYHALSAYDRGDLIDQYEHMRHYLHVLGRRIKRADEAASPVKSRLPFPAFAPADRN
ncbi:MAG TPA: hypothetical protein VNU71_13480 [Burkholderiaceae bacterium]|nr:hypothetical protein [Burkholderiaceae bacterium]